MKNSIKHITITFLIAIVMFSTMGLSVNTVYCLCTGETKISLVDIDDNCDKKPSESTPLPEGFYNLPPCCQSAIKKEACSKIGKNDHDCTKKTKKLFKADLKFLEIKKTELPNIELLAVVPLASFPKIFTPIFDRLNLQSEALPRPPPPQYFGRKLLNFIQVYRC